MHQHPSINNGTGGAGINFAAVLDTAIDVARAMAHLHKQNVLHLDLKVRNRSDFVGWVWLVGLVDSLIWFRCGGFCEQAQRTKQPTNRPTDQPNRIKQTNRPPQKARNVLLKADGKSGRGAVAKVADFGLALQMNDNDTHVSDFKVRHTQDHRS
jgi:serine/threonine protein kinase